MERMSRLILSTVTRRPIGSVGFHPVFSRSCGDCLALQNFQLSKQRFLFADLYLPQRSQRSQRMGFIFKRQIHFNVFVLVLCAPTVPGPNIVASCKDFLERAQSCRLVEIIVRCRTINFHRPAAKHGERDRVRGC